MAKKKDILVQGKKITLISSEGDYLSLTDIDAAFNGGVPHRKLDAQPQHR